MKRIRLGKDSSGRPLVVDDRTLTKLQAAQNELKVIFTIVQGSFRAGSGAAASAGTHDGGGVIDLRTWDLPSRVTPELAVRKLRENGLIAWYRHEGQGFSPHIHAIDYGNPELAPSAASQVRMWEQGYNGLASWGKDDGPRIHIPKDPPKKEWSDMASRKEIVEAAAEGARKGTIQALKEIKFSIHDEPENREWTIAQILRNLERQQDVDRKILRNIQKSVDNKE